MVVAVACPDVPAERAQLLLEIAERDDLLRELVRLQLVAIDDDPQRSQRFVGCRLNCLPVLALLELAVPGHDHDPAAQAEAPLRPRDAAPLRDAHAERAGVRLDPRCSDIGVAVETAEPTQSEELLLRDHAEPVQRRVETRDVVPLRGEEDVALRIVEAELGDVELLVEQVHEDVQRAEARPEMPRARALDRDEGVQAAHVRNERKTGVRVDVARVPHAVELGSGDQGQLRHVRHESIRSRLTDSPEDPPRRAG